MWIRYLKFFEMKNNFYSSVIRNDSTSIGCLLKPRSSKKVLLVFVDITNVKNFVESVELKPSILLVVEDVTWIEDVTWS